MTSVGENNLLLSLSIWPLPTGALKETVVLTFSVTLDYFASSPSLACQREEKFAANETLRKFERRQFLGESDPLEKYKS